MKKMAAALAILMILLFAIPLVLLKEKEKEPERDLWPDTGLSIEVYMCDSDKVVTMDLEEYILGVVAGEMPADFHPEALKAQALAARTYTMLRMRQFGGSGCSKHPGRRYVRIPLTVRLIKILLLSERIWISLRKPYTGRRER